MAKPLGAGSEVDAWCTKCRMDLGHRVVAMLNGRPKRVECQTCGSQHNYREPKTQARPPRAGARAASAKPSAHASTAQRSKAETTRRTEWESRVLGQAATAFARFSVDRTYALGDLVLHKKFGEGYVAEVLEGQKISIMFRDGARTFVHGQR